APPPEREMGESRRRRLDVGLAQEKGEPRPEQEQRDPNGDVVDPRQIADRGVEQPEAGADPAGAEHPEPRRTRHAPHPLAAHRSHHQRAFEPEVHAATLLGERLAEAHVEVRRRDADRAAGDRDEDSPPSELRGHARRNRPYSVLAARRAMKSKPSRTSVAASGRPKRRCKSPPLAVIPPSKTATATTARGFWRARNATRIPA